MTTAARGRFNPKHTRFHANARARKKAEPAAEYYSNVMMTFARACPASA